MIVSRDNPKLKSIRRLLPCKGDLAVLEGPHLVREALRLKLSLDTLLATPEFLDSGRGRDLAQQSALAPLAVAPGLLKELSDVDAPQGILAVVRLPRLELADVPVVEGGSYLYVEGVQDPGNLGAIARSAEAAGATAMVLSTGTVHPNHPRALRASAGSLLRLPTARRVSFAPFRDHLSSLDPTAVALSPHSGISIHQADLGGTLILAVGAEGSGLSPETLVACDLAVTIPIRAPVESLNATVAAAVALFEIARQRVTPTSE